MGTDARRALTAVLVALISLASAGVVFALVHAPRGGAPPGTTPTARPAAATTPPQDEPAPRPTAVARGQRLTAAAPLEDVHQDQGSSVLLPDGRSLWIFADTFQEKERPSFFVTSSAGLLDADSWRLRYSLTRGRPTEFLPRTRSEKADRGRDHYQGVWPTGSTLLPDGRILISYAKYRVLTRTGHYEFLGAGLFTYTYRGMAGLVGGGRATRIANDIWGPRDGSVRSPVFADGFVWFTQCEDLRCYSLRTTPAGLADRSTYRWWNGGGWSASPFQRRNVTVTTDHPGGNPSVVRLPSGVWAMADTEAGVAAATGRLWVARQPWGPWSRAASFDLPYCPDPGCYGLNLHPQASSPGVLRVSYAADGKRPYVRLTDVPVRMGATGDWVSTG